MVMPDRALRQLDTGSVPATRRQRSGGIRLVSSPSRLDQPASGRFAGPERESRLKICLTPLHTMPKCRLNFSLRYNCSSFQRTPFFQIHLVTHQVTPSCPLNGLWHEACDIRSGLRRFRRSREISGGPSARRSNRWILAGFHDATFCREVLR
jgi:hypothetical protein